MHISNLAWGKVKTKKIFLNQYRCRNINLSLVFYRFEKIDALGSAVLAKTPGSQDVRDKMKRLGDDKKAIDDMCQKRNKDLQDAYDLAVSITVVYCLDVDT